MASTFALAPAPKNYYFDSEGRLAIGGTLETFSSLNHTDPKPVFSDPAGLFPYINPIILDGTGGTPVPIYWEDNGVDKYYVVIRDGTGREILTIDDYPITGGGGVTPVTADVDIENHVINGQFFFTDPNTSGNDINPVQQGTTKLAPASGLFKDSNGDFVNTLDGVKSQWTIVKTGGANVNDFARFAPVVNIGVGFPAAPSSNATAFFEYEFTSSGDPFTELALRLTIPNSNTFSGETITVSFDANSDNASSAVEVAITQFFGTGGAPSPSVTTTSPFTFPNGAWSRINNIQIVVPNVAGKNLGDDKNDAIFLEWRIPQNTLGKFNLTNLQVQRGAFTTPDFIYQTFAQTQYKVLIDILEAVGGITGDIKLSANVADRAGWIRLTDISDTIGNTTSGAVFVGDEMQKLFELWWNIYPDSICPVAGGRGASASADFLANKVMTIPPYGERVFAVASGGGFGVFAGSDMHTNTVGELVPHTHLVNEAFPSVQGGNTAQLHDLGGPPTLATSSTGSGTAWDVRQQTTYVYCFIKL